MGKPVLEEVEKAGLGGDVFGTAAELLQFWCLPRSCGAWGLAGQRGEIVWANKLFEIPLFSHFSMYGCSQARTCCQQRSLTLL